jgi:excinuclease ABC subunit A
MGCGPHTRTYSYKDSTRQNDHSEIIQRTPLISQIRLSPRGLARNNRTPDRKPQAVPSITGKLRAPGCRILETWPFHSRDSCVGVLGQNIRMGITHITVRGARQHNLRNVSVSIPRNTLTVVTGLSGSGKSSLAFDTIYAEGQRRYVETLSAYARQFLDQMERPDVDAIDGLSPAISIEQKTTSRSPRSTVGTITEIYDYLRLLYASVGQPHCPNCGLPITRQTADQIIERVLARVGEMAPSSERITVFAPLVRGRKGEFREELEALDQQGFRARIDGEITELTEGMRLDKRKNHTVEAIVDRIILKPVEPRTANLEPR